MIPCHRELAELPTDPPPRPFEAVVAVVDHARVGHGPHVLP